MEVGQCSGSLGVACWPAHTVLSEYLVHQLGGFVLQETEYSSLSILSGLLYVGASLEAQIVKNLSAVQEIKV